MWLCFRNATFEGARTLSTALLTGANITSHPGLRGRRGARARAMPADAQSVASTAAMPLSMPGPVPALSAYSSPCSTARSAGTRTRVPRGSPRCRGFRRTFHGAEVRK